MDYNVIIIGCGPAGIFTALTLAENGIEGVILFDQGNELEKRSRRDARDVLCGWGGAGAYSDGKLNISNEVGGYLSEFLDKNDLTHLLKSTDEIFVKYGAPDRIFGDSAASVEEIADQASLAGLAFIPTVIRHIGTENCQRVLSNMRKALDGKVEVKTCCQVQSLIEENGQINGVKLADGQIIKSKYVVAAPGRVGANWMKGEAESLELRTTSSPVDIGVRVELPATILKKITDITYEPKLIYYSKTFDDKVRTFCMNPYGEVVIEESEGITTVNGHSYAKRKSDNTNFAILVSNTFTEPFRDPIAYGRYIARLANLLGGGAIVQRLGDLLAGRRSTKDRIDHCLTRPTLLKATPGDLSFVFPYRHLQSIIEMLQALDKLAPGVYSRHTLLYGVEVKFYSNRIEVSREMETKVKNLFAIGDGAGITRGLLQASACGVLAARAIASRIMGTHTNT
ncbi:MAG: FAD-dependent oxidoreductase [Deltaproteobacteria bacterium]|nr:FAD-dependent oxidoreductase [Deltaproteobacteria bacterium]